MIVTSTLARGAVKLSKQKVIVKHLDAIQNFGAMDILKLTAISAAGALCA